MLRKLLIIAILTITDNYCIADDIAENKPISKEYPVPQNIASYPLENRIHGNILINTPYPESISPAITLYRYSHNKIISFSTNPDPTFRFLLEGAFGIRTIESTDEDAVAFKNSLKLHQVVEIKLNTPLYKVFAIISNDKKLYKYEIYILPQSESNRMVRIITLNNFPQKQAEEILGTLHVIGENNK